LDGRLPFQITFHVKLGSLSVELPFDEAKLRLDDECLFGLEDVCTHPVFDEQGQALFLPEIQ